MIKAGSRVGAYEIIARLGAGGMGEVWRARDTRLGRDVALKLLPAALAEDPAFIARFEREAQLLAALDHPHIVGIHAVAEADGQRFLVMQLVDGKSLAERIPHCGLAVDEILAWATELADAVAAAHRRGIVHRDLKPANVMIARDGRVRVLDFGLAKESAPDGNARPGSSQLRTISAAPDVTTEGTLLGTAAYMAPEQAEGRVADARSDVWSLGVILHEMTTGRRPFTGDSPFSLLAAVIKDAAPAIGDARPDLPRQLGRIIGAALQKDPERRTQSAQDLRNQLVALAAELKAAPASAPPHRRAGPGRRRLVAGLLVAAAAGFGLGRLVPPPGVGPAAGEAPAAIERLTASGLVVGAALAPDGRYLAYVEDRAGAAVLRLRQLATGGDRAVTEPGSDALLWPAFGPDGEYLHYVRSPRQGTWEEFPATAYRIPTLGGQPRAVLRDVGGEASLSPDGTRYAAVRIVDGRRLTVVESLADGDTILLDAPGERATWEPFAWSPDGRYLASTTFGGQEDMTRIRIVEVGTGQARVLPGDWGAIDSVAWPRGADHLLASAANEESSWFFHLWRIPLDGSTPGDLTPGIGNFLGVSADSTGRRLAAIASDWFTDIWRAPPGRPDAARRVTDGFIHGMSGIDLLPDGRLVQGRRDFRLSIIDPATGAESVFDESNTRRYPAVHPDGTLIAFESWRNGGNGIWVQGLDGSPARRIVGPLESVTIPVFAGGGAWIVYRQFTDGVSTLVKSPLAGGAAETLVAEDAGTPAVAPDGQRIAFIPRQREATARIHVIALADGRELARLPLTGGLSDAILQPENLRWTPDGRSLTVPAGIVGITNLWRIPAEGGAPEQLTHFTEGSVRSHVWGPDGELFLVRGDRREDAVLVRLDH
ncbi:protein kinase [bacterium]|nr:protein kinase [bacterium]